MNNSFAPIPSTRMVSQARIQNAGQIALSQLSPYQPAADAMIDFRRVPPPAVSETADLAAAHQRMIERGVQTLLALDERNVVTGLVSTEDINPRIHQGGHAALVREVMTPFSRLEVVQLRNVLCSQVGNILPALERAERDCALVVEVADDGRGFAVRGMFCAPQILARLSAPAGLERLTG